VYENRVLRIFGPKRDEVTGEQRKSHSGELHNLYSSPDIIRQIKSRRMKWALMGEGRNVFWSESQKEKDHLEDQGIDGEWDQDGPCGDWLGGGCGVDSPSSG
jgi:hypothetical protein